MSIKQGNQIIINHDQPVTLTLSSDDPSKGIEVFSFPDNSLAAEHKFIKRDMGRRVSGATATRKAKITVVKESVLDDGTRRAMAQSANILAHSDFPEAERAQSIADLGQFLIDNKDALARGEFDS